MAIDAHPIVLDTAEEIPDLDGIDVADDDPGVMRLATDDSGSAQSLGAKPEHRSAGRPLARTAIYTGLVAVVVLSVLVGWLAVGAVDSRRTDQHLQEFARTGQQAALDLTTIDFHDVDSNVQRILDSATGTFFDDFSKRSKPFVDVVKQAQSVSVGTVTSSGVESATEDSAQVLVAVSVNTSNAGAAEQQPRAWRMRIFVQRVGGHTKVANVEFVP